MTIGGTDESAPMQQPVKIWKEFELKEFEFFLFQPRNFELNKSSTQQSWPLNIRLHWPKTSSQAISASIAFDCLQLWVRITKCTNKKANYACNVNLEREEADGQSSETLA